MIGATHDIGGIDPFEDDAQPGISPGGPAGATHPNRVAALAGPARPTAARKPAPRTAAQREASRRNGARGRGPTTAAGKAKSRLNALRHGLLAKVVCPPADVRGDDVLYRRVRAELAAEFKPATFTERALVDALAHDFVQLGRVRRMVEAVQRPPAAREEEEQWLVFRAARRDLAALGRLLDAWPVNKAPPACDAKAAARLAARVTEWAMRLCDDVTAADSAEAEGAAADALFAAAEGGTNGSAAAGGADAVPAADAAALAKWETEEAVELDQLRALWAEVRPARRLLADRDRVGSILAGRQKVVAAEGKALRLAMAGVAAGLTRWVAARADFAARTARAADQAAAALADDPARLLVLQRYLARVECAIDRKVKRLGRN